MIAHVESGRLVWLQGPKLTDWSCGMTDAEKLAVFHQLVGAADSLARRVGEGMLFASVCAELLADVRAEGGAS